MKMKFRHLTRLFFTLIIGFLSYSVSAQQPVTPYIGQYYTDPASGQSGIIFHINPGGRSGWMVDLTDVGTSAMSPNTYNAPVVTSSISDILSAINGKQATDIYYGEYVSSGSPNTFAVNTIAGNSYNYGWYLPAIGQLRCLFSALPLIEQHYPATNPIGWQTLDGTIYWSISQYSPDGLITSSKFHALDFSSGSLSLQERNTELRIRAIHDFTIEDTLQYVWSNGATTITTADNPDRKSVV